MDEFENREQNGAGGENGVNTFDPASQNVQTQYRQFVPQYSQFMPQQVCVPSADPFLDAKKGIRRVGMIVGAALLALFAMQFAAGVIEAVYIALFADGGFSNTSSEYYAFYLFTYFLMFTPALLIVRLASTQKDIFRLLKKRPTLSPYASQEEYDAFQKETAYRSALGKNLVPHVLFGTVLMMGTAYAMSTVASLVERAFNLMGLVSPDYFDNNPDTAAGWALYIIVLCVAAPVTEELFFRGAILNMLKPYGAAFAIAVQALVFAVFHGTVAQLPYTLTGGLLLGYIAYKYGGVLPTVLIHAINNGMSVLFSLLFADADILTETLASCGIYILLIGGAVLVVGAVSKRDKNVFSLKNDENSAANAMPKLTALKAFFTSPVLIVYMSAQAALMLLNMIMT